MHVTIELPDEFAQRLQTRWQDPLAHYVRERLVMEAYRDDLLSTREVQELLELDDRFAVYPRLPRRSLSATRKRARGRNLPRSATIDSVPVTGETPRKH
jgi:hypothetical protein